MNSMTALAACALLGLTCISNPAFATRVIPTRTPDDGIQPQAVVEPTGDFVIVYWRLLPGSRPKCSLGARSEQNEQKAAAKIAGSLPASFANHWLL